MNNKIAVLTWVADTANYGSILQAYALQQFLEQHGNKVDMLYYKSKVGDIVYPPKISLYWKKLINKIRRTVKNRHVSCNELYSSYRKCKEYVNENLNMTSAIVGRKEMKKYAGCYDMYICGSDQIWSVNYKCNPTYYLDWVEKGKRKIAYAPSIPTDHLNKKKISFLKKTIVDFYSLSVREENSAKDLSEILGKNVISVLDPTLMVGKDFWKEVLQSRQHNEDEEYIVCYFLGFREFYIDTVEYFAKKTGKKVIIIPTNLSSYKYGHELADSVGPIEFLQLIKNASLVLTDSFHATIFSTIFEKEFYTFERFEKDSVTTQNGRIYDLVSKLGIESRIIDDQTDVESLSDDLDYKPINERYDLLKASSQEYLLTSIVK